MIDEDLFLLEHVLWRDPSERAEVRNTIHRLLRGYVDEAKALLYQTRELRDYAHRQWESNELRGRAVVEAHTKIRHILARWTASSTTRAAPAARSTRSRRCARRSSRSSTRCWRRCEDYREG